MNNYPTTNNQINPTYNNNINNNPMVNPININNNPDNRNKPHIWKK